jgi:hypothetical protein
MRTTVDKSAGLDKSNKSEKINPGSASKILQKSVLINPDIKY